MIRADAPLNPFLSLLSHQLPHSTHFQVACNGSLAYSLSAKRMFLQHYFQSPRFQCQRMVIKIKENGPGPLLQCWTIAPDKKLPTGCHKTTGPCRSFFNWRSFAIPGRDPEQRTPFSSTLFIHASMLTHELPDKKAKIALTQLAIDDMRGGYIPKERGKERREW